MLYILSRNKLNYKKLIFFRVFCLFHLTLKVYVVSYIYKQFGGHMAYYPKDNCNKICKSETCEHIDNNYYKRCSKYRGSDIYNCFDIWEMNGDNLFYN